MASTTYARSDADAADATAAPYSADDRSLLLPWFRRWVLEPSLPWVPRHLHPNVLTLTGHVACLLALALAWSQSASAALVAVGCLWLYVWCDNADGAHARRTAQTSLLGEVLDHGLDAINAVALVEVGLLALGVKGAWASLALLALCALSPVALFGQARSGVFRLGLFNQLEGVTLASCALLYSACAPADATTVWWSTDIGRLAAAALCGGAPLAVLAFDTRAALRGGAGPTRLWLYGLLAVVASCALAAALWSNVWVLVGVGAELAFAAGLLVRRVSQARA